MDAVLSKIHIRVGSEGVDMDSLREIHGPVMVDKCLRACNMLLSSIQYLPVLTQILTAASPSEGWEIFFVNTTNRKQPQKNRNLRSSITLFAWM